MIPEILASGAAFKVAGSIKEDSLLGLLYKDTLQPSVQTLGKALGSTIEFCTTPLLLCKFGSEAAKLLYQKRLNDYADKIKDIPEENAIPVNPQIGVPILEKLTYTTNDDVANLFINLLAQASSTETVNYAHPAFIQIIERLSADEAKIVTYLKGKKEIPCVTFRAQMSDKKGYIDAVTNATDIKYRISLAFPQNIETYLDNLSSVGILQHSGTEYLIDEDEYNPLYDLLGYKLLSDYYTDYEDYISLDKEKSYFKITSFGQSFIIACTSFQ